MSKRSTIVTAASVVVLLAAGLGYRALQRTAPPNPAPTAQSEPAPHASLLYGRITTRDGVTLEGRLRFGGNQEAFWGDYFNGVKKANPWAALVPPDRLPGARRPFEIFGFELFSLSDPVDMKRPFMARFGDLARIEARGRDVRVTLKSRTVFDLDRFSASDFDDGVRIWDTLLGVKSLDSLRISSIDFVPASEAGPAPARLHGAVQTAHGVFTGFIQWDRQESFEAGELTGQSGEGSVRLRFGDVNSIAPESPETSLVTLRDGRQLRLNNPRQLGKDNLGLYVDDPRYGRVLVSWRAFRHAGFTPAPPGPAYDEFAPGHPLTGTVVSRSGQRLAGRLVFDLDESESTETLDAPAHGVDYTLPFSLIASIALDSPTPLITLHSGEQLHLEPEGDLSPNNAGLLIFVDARTTPEYFPWSEIRRIDFNRN
ncbi:MAG TPA: hypothetical protein PLF84_04635 [Bryobacteraceae bacterium]|nr:hypothetical protein [Bryobacterales bacterium]HRJ18302.1 hypothetical protein [Bryobacteraceae bacterium]